MVGNHSNKKEKSYDGRSVCNSYLFRGVSLEVVQATGGKNKEVE